jgi:glycine C-acetyltransferase
VERALASAQGARVTAGGAPGRPLLNLCANNYLGLADDERLVKAAREGLDRYGFGMASVRFICGTNELHRSLEAEVARFLRREDAVLFGSCFDANAGIFEALLDESDAVISDALNHASIIDGIRLCKARRLRYANNDMSELRRCLEEASGARTRLIVTDGVFSMDGVIANLPEICALAEEYGALVMVDDSHAVGVLGPGGRGTPEHFGLEGRVDILSGTFGKALGGASGGYIAANRLIAEWMRQRARPYLFSNALMPAICQATLTALEILQGDAAARENLRERTRQWRQGLEAAGFSLAGAGHPIVPVMIGDALVATRMAQELVRRGFLVVAFSHPVVPQGRARIRTQISAGHRAQDLEAALEAFAQVGRDLGVVGS